MAELTYSITYNGDDSLLENSPSSETTFVADYLSDSLSLLQEFSADVASTALLVQIAAVISDAMNSGRKLLLAGNGGSAADAQHLAAEFTGRLFSERAPLPAIALTTDTSALTAIGNDYGFESVFERQVLALGNAGDIFLGLSTSGDSPNVVRAAQTAQQKRLTVIGFTGSKQGLLSRVCDLLLAVPSPRTALIQQIHITAGHIVCGLVEKRLLTKSANR